LIAVGLAALLAWSAVAKSFVPEPAMVFASKLVRGGDAVALPIVLATVGLEIGVCAGLLIHRTRFLAFVALGGFLVLATALLVTARYQGVSGSCGCFGVGPSAGGLRASIIRNGALLLLCAAGVVLTPSTGGEAPEEVLS